MDCARPLWPQVLLTLVLLLTLASSDRSAGQAQATTKPLTRVVMLGTGTPLADPDRSGPGVAIVVGGNSYLIDAGPGIVRRAAAAARKGVPALHVTNLKHVFITHLHSDHTLGLPDLMFSPWTLGRATPLAVYGPRGIALMTSHIEEAWEEDVRVRAGLEGRRERGHRAVAHEIDVGKIYDDGTVRVDAVAVPHATWNAAFGFRFTTADRTVVVSGDTRPSDAIAEACNRCDVLVHEVYSSDYFSRQGNQRYHSSAHTSTAQLAAVAEKARPRLLVLYHQLLGAATDADLEREVRAAGYRGTVVSARDLEVF